MSVWQVSVSITEHGWILNPTNDFMNPYGVHRVDFMVYHGALLNMQ